MIFIQFKKSYQKLLFFIFLVILPSFANSTTDATISEKRIGAAMRMIGHEVLMCVGDTESRIMPIEKINTHYKISFEFELGFDPGDIILIINQVVKETKIATNYFVEVEQCETKEVVHSFEIGNAFYPGLIPCQGRILPKDCYSLLITILDGPDSGLSHRRAIANLQTTASDSSAINIGSVFKEVSSAGRVLTASGTKKASLIKSAFFIISLFILIGFIAYLFKKKNPGLPGSQATEVDTDLILIGASEFDKKNMALSFENKSVALSNKEVELLSVLHNSVNVPIEREVILKNVWGDEGSYVGRTLDVFISKLRKKLEADASVKIVNIRGVGYKLVMDTPKKN